jgi:Zinc knuckle
MEEQRNQIRVELIQQPSLRTLTKKSINHFKEEYEIYRQKVEAQGNNGRPMSRFSCISIDMRRTICNQIGKRYLEATESDIWQKIEEICDEEGLEKGGIDPRQIFNGVKMDIPTNQGCLVEKLQKYFAEISKRITKFGVEEELFETSGQEFRKQAFPNIINGVWPSGLAETIHRKYRNSSRNWTLGDLLSNIDREVKAVGRYEIDRIRKSRNEMGKFETDRIRKSRNEMGKFETEFRRDKPRWEAKDTKSFEDQQGEKKLKCFNCGKMGHKKMECKLNRNNEEAKKGRRTLFKRETKRLKRLQTNLTQLLSDGEVFSNSEEDVESADSPSDSDVQ